MPLDDFYAVQPDPEIAPDVLGTPPPPQPPLFQPEPGPASQEKRQKLLAVFSAIAGAVGGPSLYGLPAGVLQGQQRLDHQRQQDANRVRMENVQAQRQYQWEQEQYTRQLQQRQQTLAQTVASLRTQMRDVPTKAAYDQQIEGYTALLQHAGYRVQPNWLRQVVPYVAPNQAAKAAKALDEYLKNPNNEKVWKQDPKRAAASMIPYDRDDDGVPEDVTVREVAALAGRPFGKNAITQEPEFSEAGSIEVKASADGILQQLVEKDKAEGKRASPERLMALQQQAIRMARDAARVAQTSDPAVQSLARETAAMNLALKEEQLKAARAKNAPPAESPYAQERTRRIIESVDGLMGKVSSWTVGPGSLLRNVPASAATDFDAELNTLKSNIAFGELAEMRAASKTGGALGAVSDRETALLESAMGALNTKQSAGNFRRQLARIRASLQRWDQAKQQSNPPSSLPVGTIKTFPTGKRGRWDGSGWELVE